MVANARNVFGVRDLLEEVLASGRLAAATAKRANARSGAAVSNADTRV
jgi:hypothetical protein